VDLPKAPAPAGSYVPNGRYGKAPFIAGQIGVQQGTGSARLGAELGVEEGRAEATAAGLAVLAQIAAGTDGRVSTVRRIVRLGVFIAASTDFMQHPEVANAASELMVAVFGEAGRHARTAVPYTPLDMTARNLNEIVRASVSYFNTEVEITRLAASVTTMARSAA
jgi:enamine deaminase RidA (YjgF/YER057c/UK114 family)